MGGSSKKVTVGYRYFLGMHMVLCHGPIDKILRITVDDRVAWRDVSTGGDIEIDEEGLFGGEAREGGVSGTITLAFGESTQSKSSYLIEHLGNSVPAFRKVCSAIFQDMYLGLNPYLKPWAFRAQRILTSTDGQDQWYPDKAKINSQYSLVFRENFGSLDSYEEISGQIDGVFDLVLSPYGNALQSNGGGTGGVHVIARQFTTEIQIIDQVKVIFRLETSANNDATEFYIDDVSGSTIFFFSPRVQGGGEPTCGVTRGSATAFTTTPVTIGKWYQLVATESLGTWTARIFDLSNNSQHGNDVTFSSGTLDGRRIRFFATWTSAAPITQYAEVRLNEGTISDMNPAHIIRECLTDPDWGLGTPTDDIDDTSFQEAADTLFFEEMGISILWDRETKINDFIGEIARHIDATVFVDSFTGKFTIKLIRDDYSESNLVALGEDEIIKIEDYDKQVFGEYINTVIVKYWDINLSAVDTAQADDIALVQQQGQVISTTIEYPGFTNGEIAARVAQRDLRALSSPTRSCTIYANREGAELNVGHAFFVDWPDLELNNVIMRVIDIDYGGDLQHQIIIKAIEDVFSLPFAPINSAPESITTPISEAAGAPGAQILIEAPYLELIQRLGETTLNSQIEETPDIGYLIAAGSRPSTTGALSARLFVDSGAGFEDSAQVDFAPYAILDLDLSITGTELFYVDDIDFDLLEVGQIIQLNQELMVVNGKNSSSLTVGRGVLDTVPQPHEGMQSLGSSAPIIYCWDSLGESDIVQYTAGESVSAKITPYSAIGTYALADAIAMNLVFNERAIRPYPPGNVRINDSLMPSLVDNTDPVVITWSHRDRTQQTSGTIYDTTAGDIGPEVGTTYNLRIYQYEYDTAQNEIDSNTDMLVEEQTGLSTTTFNWTPPSQVVGFYRLEIESVRSGYTSLQAQSFTFEIIENAST